MKSALMIIKLSISLIKIMAIYQSPNYYVLWTYLVNEGVYLWRFLIKKIIKWKEQKAFQMLMLKERLFFPLVVISSDCHFS